jgi:F420-non-reducing hydrogenase iron-sulfur subunit
MNEYNPKILCFKCNFGWGYLGDKNEIKADAKSMVPVTCSGKVDTTHILTALKGGADGVLILGCSQGECHFQDGNYQTGKKILLLKKVLSSFGLEPERVRMLFAIDPDGSRIPQEIETMRNELSLLGPIKIGSSALTATSPPP